jgi:3-phosphoshikimate 1-carboxyvinyltransferase
MHTVSCDIKNFNGEILLPFSKSESNRLLIIQAVSSGKINIHNLSDSGDTLLMQKCLADFQNSSVIDAQNAGTVFRFLTAFLANQKGSWTLTGSERMLKRPIGPLVDALKCLGAEIDYISEKGFPPLKIAGGNLKGGKVGINTTVSSQFVSALLLVAPGMENGLEISLEGELHSEPYIHMTIELMKRCGAKVERNGRRVDVLPGVYAKADIEVEPDWSSASFFYKLAAISESCKLFFPGLKQKSLQGDAILAEIFVKLGVKTIASSDGISIEHVDACVTEFEFDFKNHPDIFIPVTLTCAAKGIKFKATGTKNLIFKESDRLRGFTKQLVDIGFKAEVINDDLFQLFPSGKINNVNTCIDVQSDHRMAMAFATLSAVYGQITINNIEVAGKSFPDFFQQLKKLGFQISL